MADWASVFPAARAAVPGIDNKIVLKKIEDGEKNFLIIDVRREDWEGGMVTGALNLPAQTFYYSRHALLDIAIKSGVEHVIFYCGSCNGRGPRCAGWFQDLIDEESTEGKKISLEVSYLIGGIKGWARDFKGKQMLGFDEEFLKKLADNI
ncbi:hypothetical protein BHYA_0544g00030 [Botrytis hyacinthi]|uniref:Rhodanese domain-containing protein n=1 Tax=Botrytis hyacinthi TaxID=278943 RepID=A0A4Z1G3K8_9HELO|nr:hypothetical protein BHYA_0544g00030 [Botrytis hyacinthi]